MAGYSTLAEFRSFSGLGANVVDSLTEARIEELIETASRLADGYAMTQYKPPFTAPGVDWRQRVCWVAAWLVMCEVGFNPSEPNPTVMKNYEDALSWFEGVAKGSVVPLSTADQTATEEEGAPAVLSFARRGW